ncbi:hypothetical protein CHX27_13280 [Flavobacterium aurantiibacter]|uniref:Uncharacterized protein n=1 Tax=Flavobacterium aurantiibacter TaxID=2023067 RepID=A0A255ZGM4_9FLAO|nr:hypothetical protein CHX27_13280 [Flavobacterium aurantiibacter]
MPDWLQKPKLTFFIALFSTKRWLRIFQPRQTWKARKAKRAILPKAAATERSRELHVQNTPFWCVLETNGGKSWPEEGKISRLKD